MTSPPQLAETFFRHEYGRLVATLSRRVGARHIDAIEDAVQGALLSALQAWTASGVPDNPGAWLYRAAHNRLTDQLRQHHRRERIVGQNAGDVIATMIDLSGPEPHPEMHDDVLRMLFLCCDDAIPLESQLVLALKVLCGFEVREIALRLFTSPANVYERLARAKTRLRAKPPPSDGLHDAQYTARLPAVRTILYLMFTEGYLSSHAEIAIRVELCAEAIRLTGLLAHHPIGASPETSALLALMHLHSARLTTRMDAMGELLRLEEQDRAFWDQVAIAVGMTWLADSAAGETVTRFHAEARIAAEHCLAPTMQETRWKVIIECYDLLERIAPSPLYRLNRAIAVAELQGAQAGLAVLHGFAPPTWLEGSYLCVAVMADLYQRAGDTNAARRYRELAFELAPSDTIRRALERRLSTRQGDGCKQDSAP